MPSWFPTSGFRGHPHRPFAIHPRQLLGSERLSPRRHNVPQRPHHLVHYRRGQAGSERGLVLFEETADGVFAHLSSESGAKAGVIPYRRRRDVAKSHPRAVRGLSPGTQKVLTLTEAERVRHGLIVGEDVVPCVTSLRTILADVSKLDDDTFRSVYRDTGQKCWLIRTDRDPRRNLEAYLNSVPAADRATATCLEREVWWKFNMPPIPDLLMSQCFRRLPQGGRKHDEGAGCRRRVRPIQY